MRRVEELDSLRGLAALAIIVYHLPVANGSPLGGAIYLFFVLSGYLITSILLRHAPSGEFLFAFYARRGLRIWPIYYLAICGVALINPWMPNPERLDGLSRYLTFTQFTGYYWSDSVSDQIRSLRHTWSLAVEEQFYLIWPALLVLVGRRRLAGTAMAVAAAAVAMRALGYNRWILATNCDGLALGGLLAGLLHDRSPAEARGLYGRRFAALGLAAAAVWAGGARLPLPDGWSGALLPVRVVAMNLVFFAMVGLVSVHAGDRRLAPLRDRRLVYLGTISYGLYLYHHIIYYFFDDYATSAGVGDAVRDAAKVATSFLAAVLSERLIERPLGTLKRLFPYPAAGSPEPVRPRPGFLPARLPLAGPEEG